MTKYREILRLLSNELKTDEVVDVYSVSKRTVIKVKKRVAEMGIRWPLRDDMADEKLEVFLFSKPRRRSVPNACLISITSGTNFSATV